MKNIEQIIKDAGGARAISQASENDSHQITFDAVYKWKKLGIPDRHWPLIMSLTKTTPSELFTANQRARSS